MIPITPSAASRGADLPGPRAAVEEGVVPGGGNALIRVLRVLKDLEGANEDQTVGIRPLARSSEEPLRQIVEERRRRRRACPQRATVRSARRLKRVFGEWMTSEYQ